MGRFRNYLFLTIAFLNANSLISCQKMWNNDVLNTAVRLSPNVIPENYEISLEIHLNDGLETDFTFSGSETITLKLNATVENEILLHSDNLDIKSVKLYEDSTLISTKFSISNQDTTLSITFKKELEIGEYSLAIEFEGKLGDSMSGLYRTSYILNRETIWGAATLFSSVGARKAFPCFDEPEMRATFQITIIHSSTLTAFSNMDLIDSNIENDMVTSAFNKTPAMSTYLVGIVLTDFVSFSTDSIISIWTSPELLSHSNNSILVATNAKNLMESFTKFSYSLPKLDHMSVPQYASGATENWGLISYQMENLIFDPNTETSAKEFSVIRIISHETSHMWFGDLVGPFWWSYIWLNEGFATFFEYFLPSQTYPDWGSMDLFVVDVQQTIMISDALISTHSVEIEVDDPRYWSADDIAYKKAGSVIRMMQHILTPNIFQKGLQNYIAEKQYGSAITEDLWKSLQEAVDGDDELTLPYLVSRIGDSWINQAGYPIVTVAHGDSTLYLNQTRYLVDSVESYDTDSTIWLVPITVATKSKSNFSNTIPKYWMNETELSVELNYYILEDDWIIVNYEQTGYYRVNYSVENWKLLADYLKNSNEMVILNATRAQLLDDVFTFAINSQLDISVALAFSEFLENEEGYAVWNSVLKHFTFLEKHLAFSSAYKNWHLYLQKLTNKVYASVYGIDGRNTDLLPCNLNILNIVNVACQVGNADCVSRVVGKFNSTLGHEMPNLQPAVYCAAVRYGTQHTWDMLENQYTTDGVSQSEKARIATALGCSSDVNILHTYLMQITKPDPVIKEIDIAFQSIYMNGPAGINTTLYFLEENPDFFSTNENFIPLMGGLADRLVTEQQLQRFTAIINGTDELQPLLDVIEANIKWHNAHISEIENWLMQVDPINSTTPIIATTPSKAGTNSMFLPYVIGFSLISLYYL